MTKRAEDMSVEELLKALPASFRARRDADGSIVIDEAPREPWPQEVSAAWARHQSSVQARARIERARELAADGSLSKARIGIIIAAEEGRLGKDGAVRPYTARAVRTWLAGET